MIHLFASGGILLLDQWSKSLVQVHVGDRCISWGPIVRIRRTTNRKAFYAYNSCRIALMLVWLAALAAAVVLSHSGLWFQGERALFGLGLAFGGAAGNLLDVLRRHCIIDFIDLRWWPVFNLADVAIIAGLLMAFWPGG